MPYDSFTRSQAWYLWRKLNSGNLSRSLLSRLCTQQGDNDLWGGWFADFFYESMEW